MREPKTIAVVGLGLMGGSLAAACRRKFPRARVIGISRSADAIRFALKKHWIHRGFRDLKQGVKHADLVVLCTPVDTFQKTLVEIDRFAKPNAVVTDVGSIKGEILRGIARRRFQRIRFVGAHPMVGSHLRGIHAADPNLYAEGFTFLISTARTQAASYALAKSFWRKLTPRVVEVSADEHDRTVSEISHLPHALAVCLVLAVREKAMPFAASGFADATRIAQGDPSIWVPIFKMNRRALERSLVAFEKRLKKFKRALASRRRGSLDQMLFKASRKRRQILF